MEVRSATILSIVSASTAAVVIAFAACSSSSPVPSNPSDAAVETDTKTGHCLLQGEACSGATECCPPIRGYLVDEDAGCKASASTAIACWPPGPCTSHTATGLLSCYEVPDSDGGTARYYTTMGYPRTTQLVPCSNDVQSRITAYPNCP